MTPSEVDAKIVKLLRLSKQRDNANEARSARTLAYRLAKRFDRDIARLERVAEGRSSSPPPSPSSYEDDDVYEDEDVDDEEFDDVVRDFGTLLGGVFDVMFPSGRPSKAVRVGVTLHEHRDTIRKMRDHAREGWQNRKKKGS